MVYKSTITDRVRRLRSLIKLGANLFDPKNVKEVIANQSWSEARKEAMVYTYDLWARWAGIQWERPSYKPPKKLPFILLEREIDALIASCNKYVANFLQMAKETGASGKYSTLNGFSIG